MQAKLSRPEYAPVAHSLSEIGHLLGGRAVLDLRRPRPRADRAGCSDAIINRDRNLRLQYLAGLGLNLYQSDRIYSDMLAHARYPEGLFTGTRPTLSALREAIAASAGARDDAVTEQRTNGELPHS